MEPGSHSNACSSKLYSIVQLKVPSRSESPPVIRHCANLVNRCRLTTTLLRVWSDATGPGLVARHPHFLVPGWNRTQGKFFVSSVDDLALRLFLRVWSDATGSGLPAARHPAFVVKAGIVSRVSSFYPLKVCLFRMYVDCRTVRLLSPPDTSGLLFMLLSPLENDCQMSLG